MSFGDVRRHWRTPKTLLAAERPFPKTFAGNSLEQAIPKTKENVGERINLTLRQSAKRNHETHLHHRAARRGHRRHCQHDHHHSEDVDRSVLAIFGQNLTSSPLEFLIGVSCESLECCHDFRLTLTWGTIAEQVKHPATNVECRIVHKLQHPIPHPRIIPLDVARA